MLWGRKALFLCIFFEIHIEGTKKKRVISWRMDGRDSLAQSLIFSALLECGCVRVRETNMLILEIEISETFSYVHCSCTA
jgi:hypothetical protein